MIYTIEVHIPCASYVLLAGNDTYIAVYHIECDVGTTVDATLYPSDNLPSSSIILLYLKIMGRRAVSIRGEYEIGRDSIST